MNLLILAYPKPQEFHTATSRHLAPANIPLQGGGGQEQLHYVKEQMACRSSQVMADLPESPSFLSNFDKK
jgi:hypothetical protein